MEKKYIYYLGLGILLFTSCTLMSHHQSRKSVHYPPSKPVFTGWLTEQQLLSQIQEYQLEKDRYQPDPQTLEILKEISTNIQILVFLGTWCPDSQREVPRFLKIMDLIQNSHISYKLFGLDRTKKDPEGLAENHQLEFVPTFIVLQNDTELDRIVERPMVSIEQDLADILASGGEKK